MGFREGVGLGTVGEAIGIRALEGPDAETAERFVSDELESRRPESGGSESSRASLARMRALFVW